MLPLAVSSPVTGSILTTVLGSILCKSLLFTEFTKSSILMSSTFFMLPLANRINEPLVKLDDLGEVGGRGSGAGSVRRSFLGDGSAVTMLLLMWLLLLLWLWLLLWWFWGEDGDPLKSVKFVVVVVGVVVHMLSNFRTI